MVDVGNDGDIAKGAGHRNLGTVECAAHALLAGPARTRGSRSNPLLPGFRPAFSLLPANQFSIAAMTHFWEPESIARADEMILRKSGATLDGYDRRMRHGGCKRPGCSPNLHA
ncbi:hypothetical protein PUN4_1060016 [Paraburkholderia unamae]|nr:hypothetical protein PUN4_1060016 [Paraburkholderia unamae]